MDHATAERLRAHLANCPISDVEAEQALENLLSLGDPERAEDPQAVVAEGAQATAVLVLYMLQSQVARSGSPSEPSSPTPAPG